VHRLAKSKLTSNGDESVNKSVDLLLLLRALASFQKTELDVSDESAKQVQLLRTSLILLNQSLIGRSWDERFEFLREKVYIEDSSELSSMTISDTWDESADGTSKTSEVEYISQSEEQNSTLEHIVSQLRLTFPYHAYHFSQLNNGSRLLGQETEIVVNEEPEGQDAAYDENEEILDDMTFSAKKSPIHDKTHDVITDTQFESVIGHSIGSDIQHVSWRL
jgi:hypothetical protein